ncbi:hypothetical protein COTS27_00288 [Spirochaetota bacterium]|nr:hypothetical protein COTS27_00288 [Spirochaetota bacterium]
MKLNFYLKQFNAKVLTRLIIGGLARVLVIAMVGMPSFIGTQQPPDTTKPKTTNIAPNTSSIKNQNSLQVQPSHQGAYDYTFAVVKYNGGGDWYEGQVGIKELMKFINKHDIMTAAPKSKTVEITSDLFEYPLLYITGHGGFVVSTGEAARLREYLENGGMLFINDDYGLDPFVQKVVKKIFPDRKWSAPPLSHPLYHIYYQFPNGAPKVHKHDGGPPEVQAIFHDGEIAILYTKNTDIGDGWAPYHVHKDSSAIRQQALRFGMNVILYALTK